MSHLRRKLSLQLVVFSEDLRLSDSLTIFNLFLNKFLFYWYIKREVSKSFNSQIFFLKQVSVKVKVSRNESVLEEGRVKLS